MVMVLEVLESTTCRRTIHVRHSFAPLRGAHVLLVIPISKKSAGNEEDDQSLSPVVLSALINPQRFA